MMFSLLIFLPSMAGDLRVELSRNSHYEIDIDGRTYRSDGSSTIRDLRSGRHRIMVKQKLSSYRYKTIYSGFFSIDRNEVLVLEKDRRNRIEIRSVSNSPYYGGGNDECRPDYGPQRPNYPTSSVSRSMSNREFKRLEYAMEKERRDNDKEELLSRALRIRSVSTKELSSLIRTIDSDRNRLRALQDAYEKTRDKTNYERLRSALRYESYRREFDQFLRRENRSLVYDNDRDWDNEWWR